MSVIGRLDEQVDAVLIEPLRTKRPPEEKVAPVSPPGHDVPDDADRPHATAENEDDGDASSALPVWML